MVRRAIEPTFANIESVSRGKSDIIEDQVYRLTWHKADQDANCLRDQLVMALIESGACVMLQDRYSNYKFIANLPDCWHVQPGDEPSDVSIFGVHAASRLAQLKANIEATGEPGRLELQQADRIFRFRVRSITLDGPEHQFVIAIDELTEERRRERLRQTLLREVNHRSRNLLAIIQSLAVQTAKREETLDGFLQKFRGRLYSLSRSQDLLTDASWNGVLLFDLVRVQGELILAEHGLNLIVMGENVLLTPNAELHIGLALHELIANSKTYGALANGKLDDIAITCRHFKIDQKSMVELTWHEETGAQPDGHFENIVQNFGSIVLIRVVPASVNGVAQYNISDRKVDYKLIFPAE